ncbi:mitotic spindle assembly checkpoint protein MAD1 [Pycnococcus provasolii]
MPPRSTRASTRGRSSGSGPTMPVQRRLSSELALQVDVLPENENENNNGNGHKNLEGAAALTDTFEGLDHELGTLQPPSGHVSSQHVMLGERPQQSQSTLALLASQRKRRRVVVGQTPGAVTPGQGNQHQHQQTQSQNPTTPGALVASLYGGATPGHAKTPYQAAQTPMPTSLLDAVANKGHRIAALEAEVAALQAKNKEVEDRCSVFGRRAEAAETALDTERVRAASASKVAAEGERGAQALASREAARAEQLAARARDAEARAEAAAELARASKESEARATAEKARAESEAARVAASAATKARQSETDVAASAATLARQVKSEEARQALVSAQAQVDEACADAESARAELAKSEEARSQLEVRLAQAEARAAAAVASAAKAAAATPPVASPPGSLTASEVRRLKAEVEDLRRRAEGADAARERALAAEAKLAQTEDVLSASTANQAAEDGARQELSRWRALVPELVTDHASARTALDGPSALRRVLQSAQDEAATARAAQGEAMASAKASEAALAKAKASVAVAEAAAADAEARRLEAVATAQREVRRAATAAKERDGLERLLKSFEAESRLGTAAVGSDAAAAAASSLASSSTEALRAELEAARADAASAEAARDEQRALASSASKKLAEAEAMLTAGARETESLAAEAEVLRGRLGRGEYDPAKTKVLHLPTNPLSDAVEARCAALAAEVAELRKNGGGGGGVGGGGGAAAAGEAGGVEAASAAASAAAELEKHKRRYMRAFREQIGLFREACWHLFGYRLTMETQEMQNSDDHRGEGAPHFSVRSMFASDESETLRFRYVDGTETGSPARMEMLSTPYADSDEVNRMWRVYAPCVPALLSNLVIDSWGKFAG